MEVVVTLAESENRGEQMIARGVLVVVGSLTEVVSE